MDDVIVLKCGGSTLENLEADFFESIAAMQRQGMNPVIVHGGGPAINRRLEKDRVPTEFVDGLRRTTPQVLEAVEKALTGDVQRELVRALENSGACAKGVTGSENGLLQASPVDIEKLGLVGDVDTVHTEQLEELMHRGCIPVIAPIASSKNYGRLNVNADAAAAAAATALGAVELIFVTDVDGVLRGGKLEETLTESSVKTYMEEGIIYGGMIPKVKAAAACLEGSIQKVTIANGNGKNKNEDGTLKGTTVVKEHASTAHTIEMMNNQEV
ncbi:acetylglutamate kinase [Salibacterium halotolerans]|uniref:Acetylglutamate kinase n=1 Tax=Salibacterium halotolerans TaxID=1884432 RepID=A0A1I5T7N0_9BACI|nr:acetylglutamate kinase [Salibacterium halotolerans]SFP79049.1 acetylglutamate kinase [Salibacterium halotolerans]